MTIDVRAVLDGKVWPQDPHDFVGDEVDILREQLALVDEATCADAARQLLQLLGDTDLAVRARAVLALDAIRMWIDDAAAHNALRTHRNALQVASPDMWKIRTPTLWEEAHSQLGLPRPSDGD